MKILVTGSAGFIGYHLCLKLLKNKTFKVYGIDNFNSYYDIKLKKIRNNFLLKKKFFSFKKIDFTQKKKLDNFISKIKPDIIFHIGGQPGVRYSYKNPGSYKKNNIIGTKILCNLALKYKVKKFIFASSSSVYGDQKKYPIKENFEKKPKNYYAKTKLACEKIILNKFKNSKTNFFIFRLFTVYGPLGRPDMFVHKFLNNLKIKKTTKIFNYGKNYRDCTYIDDVIDVLNFSINTKISNKILNVCKSNPIQTINLIKIIKKNYKSKVAKIKFIKKQKGEVLKTFGSNDMLKFYLKKIKFKSIDFGIKNTINSFKKLGY